MNSRKSNKLFRFAGVSYNQSCLPVSYTHLANLNEVNMELTPEVEASIPEVIKVIWGLI